MAMRKRKDAMKGKHTPIFLEGVVARKVEERYDKLNILEDDDDRSDSEDGSFRKTTTRLTELRLGATIPPLITIIDPSKNKIKAWVTMRDYLNYGPLPEITDIHCWWCSHPFETSPIGLPIKYHKAGEVIEYKDTMVKIPKDDTVQPSPKKTKSKFKKKKRQIEDDYFETDGIFCSFCCAQAFYKENKHMLQYRESKQLLLFLYYKLYGKHIDEISPAPHWRILKVKGGKLSIKEYRNSFCKIVYKITDNIRRPFMFPCGMYVEEKDIF
jgi:hypothetical protein